MNDVLRKLQGEVFVLSLAEPVAATPEIRGFPTLRRNELEIEVEVDRRQSLNEVFRELEAQNVSVVSMRNKANRLEELFMRLVEGKQSAREKESAG
jgi:ABC-2 type transport system ATP-binding protein